MGARGGHLPISLPPLKFSLFLPIMWAPLHSMWELTSALPNGHGGGRLRQEAEAGC